MKTGVTFKPVLTCVNYSVNYSDGQWIGTMKWNDAKREYLFCPDNNELLDCETLRQIIHFISGHRFEGE